MSRENNGNSPKSKANLVAGKNSKSAKKTMLTLSPKARTTIASAGDNNMSEGVERLSRIYEKMNQNRLFRQSSVFGRCKLMLGAIVANPSSVDMDQIEALLFDMESLEIEELHKEAVLDGVIKVKSGAWIA